jgi:uncharacterized protein
MSYNYRLPMLHGAISMIAFAIIAGGQKTSAAESGTKSGFVEHQIEFQNQDVKLGGSLLLPSSDVPVPAVIFVHGAGQQTREPYREVGEYFASQGIAALTYDKRGTGRSGGAYESAEPYENLVNDALSAVAFLKQRREIAATHIGIWGLSQGAYISAAAASRSEKVKFIIVVGADAADGMMFFYRDNLFRRYGLSAKLRDVAEKAYLIQQSLPHSSQDGFLLSSFARRSYCSPDRYVHPAWSHVKQPVLAMWGQLDQHVPVGESVVGLKNSLAQAHNEKWTMIILPLASHSLGISVAGGMQEKWRGYAPGALKTMTDWAWKAIDHPSEIDKMKQEGKGPDAEVLSKLAHYESLRWFGNLVVQTAFLAVFLISFLANTIAGVRYGFTQLFTGQPNMDLAASQKVVNLKRAICALNLSILVAFSITVFSVMDQIHPRCPAALIYLPLLGTISALATVFVLILIARTAGDRDWKAARGVCFSLDILCIILFVPYMFYWNLIGLGF